MRWIQQSLVLTRPQQPHQDTRRRTLPLFLLVFSFIKTLDKGVEDKDLNACVLKRVTRGSIKYETYRS